MLFVFSTICFSAISLPKHLQEIPYGIMTLPEDGADYIVCSIKKAKKTVDITNFHMNYPTILEELKNARSRGVKIRVILQQPNRYKRPFALSENAAIAQELRDVGIQVVFLSHKKDYSLCHYKMLIIDGEYALVSTFNFDNFNIENARNFGVFTEDVMQVEALRYLFDNDFIGKVWKSAERALDFQDRGIIIGPESQREYFLKLLKGAEAVWIYQQDITDPEISNTLSVISKNGVPVNILMSPNPFGFSAGDLNTINIKNLESSGVKFGYLPKKSGKYIHAKVVVIKNSEGFYAYVGSCNFWAPALSANRELGIEVSGKAAEKIYQRFLIDQSDSFSYEEAVLFNE